MFFFNAARGTGGIFFLSNIKEELFKLVRFRFEKSTIKWNTNVWNLDLGKKMANSNWKLKCVLPLKEVIFFSECNQKVQKKKFFIMVRVRNEKQVSEVRKKWETNVWNLDLGKKIARYFFLICVLAPLEVYFL